MCARGVWRWGKGEDLVGRNQKRGAGGGGSTQIKKSILFETHESYILSSHHSMIGCCTNSICLNQGFPLSFQWFFSSEIGKNYKNFQ